MTGSDGYTPLAYRFDRDRGPSIVYGDGFLALRLDGPEVDQNVGLMNVDSRALRVVEALLEESLSRVRAARKELTAPALADLNHLRPKRSR